MDIAEFLIARYDEDELLAREATPGPWSYNPGKVWLDPDAFERFDLSQGEEYVAFGGPSPFTGCVAATGEADHPQSMADATYIARHDPARALRAVEAKRRILARHSNNGEMHACIVKECGAFETHWWRTTPCPTLRDLAEPYAEHADFDPAWALEHSA